ncbi:MAG TPA: MarC family protein [Terriglobia bacterium]|jgi:multiple antibiotic resistance protein|nr:MarC family protein [Terriglobia bacterium]
MHEVIPYFRQLAHATFLALAALLPIVNPIGSAALFLALTQEQPNPVRQTLARKIAINSFFLLAGSVLVGTYVLEFFGISIPVVQIGGGLVVLATAWSMLNQKEAETKSDVRRADCTVDPEFVSEQAFYPLTLPVTVGPGSISVAITLGANLHGGQFNRALLIVDALLASAIVAFLVFLCDWYAEWLSQKIGRTGMNVAVRLSSFLLLCIGVQILWNGASSLLGIRAH